MLIKNEMTLAEIEQQFSDQFKNLKMEFYFDEHHSKQGTIAKPINKSKKLGDVRVRHHEGAVILSPYMTVEELESLFHDIYGLNVQIFRKSGNLWLQTTVTDTWALKDQNLKGSVVVVAEPETDLAMH